MLKKLRPSELLTAAGATVLFAATLNLWFTLPGVPPSKITVADPEVVVGSSDVVDLNVWDLHIGRWFIYLAILSAAWMVVAAAMSHTPEYAVIMGTPTVFFGFAASVCLIDRLFNAPVDGVARTTWFYLAVAGGLTILAGGFWSLRNEFVPAGYEKAPTPEVVHLDSAP